MHLARHFSTCESIRNIEKTRKHYLRTVLDDYDTYYDILLRKSEKETLGIKW